MIEDLDPDIKAHFDALLKEQQWVKGNLQYKLDTLQQSITAKLRSIPFKRASVLSSRQIGKSYWDCSYALEYLSCNPNTIARIIAPTLDQCADIVNDNLTPIIADSPTGFINRIKSDYRWDLYNGSSLRLGGLKRAHVDSNRGSNASLVIYEECGFVDADSFTYGVNSVLGPQLLRSNGIELFVTSPSEDPDHPLHTIILPECEDIGTAFQYTVFHSPSITNDMIIEAGRRTGTILTREFIQAVRSLPVITIQFIHALAGVFNIILTDAFRREYMAEIIRSKSLMVVPYFDYKKHVLELDIPRGREFTITIDWGGVRDLTVALLHTYDFLINKDQIYAELVFPPNTPTEKIVKKIRDDWESQYPIEGRFADVAGQTQVDLANTHNFVVCIPAKSDWLASVTNMSNCFSLSTILIDPRCTFLIKSCRGGMFNKNKTDFNRSDVEGGLGHCDALAALMYGIRSQNKAPPMSTEHYVPNINFYVPPKTSDIERVAAQLAPKRFGKLK